MLNSIQTIRCPICGCSEIIQEYVETSCYTDIPRIKEHCNGTRWESRTFLCGYTTKFIPNFLSEQPYEYSECINDPDVIARKEKEKQDKENIKRLLIENNISESMIDKIERYCL